jgi:hypothetical protein
MSEKMLVKIIKRRNLQAYRLIVFWICHISLLIVSQCLSDIWSNFAGTVICAPTLQTCDKGVAPAARGALLRSRATTSDPSPPTRVNIYLFGDYVPSKSYTLP